MSPYLGGIDHQPGQFLVIINGFAGKPCSRFGQLYSRNLSGMGKNLQLHLNRRITPLRDDAVEPQKGRCDHAVKRSKVTLKLPGKASAQSVDLYRKLLLTDVEPTFAFEQTLKPLCYGAQCQSKLEVKFMIGSYYKGRRLLS